MLSGMTRESKTLEASFGRAAPLYRTHARVQAALAQWLAEWVPSTRAGRALECGAGTGLFTERLLPWDGRLVASDLSPRMCAEGREHLPDVPWTVAPAEQPPPGPWDWIFSSGMLQWINRPIEAFAAWRRALAPGGRVLAAWFVAGTLPEWHELAGEAAPIAWRTAAEWKGALRDAGLRLMREDLQTRIFHHPSARALLRSIHGVGAAPERRLPPSTLRRLLAEYDRRHPAPEGVHSTWAFYRLEAQKR